MKKKRYFNGNKEFRDLIANLTNLGFTGHQHNNDLGLVYMNARFYVPGVGKFASADTIIPAPTRPQSYNRYAYVENNPLNATDPSGHCTVSPLFPALCASENLAMAIYVNSLKVERGFDNYSPGMNVTGWFYQTVVGNANGAIATWLSISNIVDPVGALAIWTIAVNNNQVWDIKVPFEENQLNFVNLTHRGKNYAVTPDVLGNIHYGFVGRASGFHGLVLLFGAGVAQRWGNCKGEGCKNPLTFGDEPSDAMSILFGITVYDQYGRNVSEENFMDTFAYWHDYGLFDRDLMRERAKDKESWNDWLSTLPQDLFNALNNYGLGYK